MLEELGDPLAIEAAVQRAKTRQNSRKRQMLICICRRDPVKYGISRSAGSNCSEYAESLVIPQSDGCFSHSLGTMWSPSSSDSTVFILSVGYPSLFRKHFTDQWVITWLGWVRVYYRGPRVYSLWLLLHQQVPNKERDVPVVVMVPRVTADVTTQGHARNDPESLSSSGTLQNP